MTLEQINELVEAIYDESFKRKKRLARVYEAALESAAGAVAYRFERETLTAGAWTPPPAEVLSYSLTDDDLDAADAELGAAARGIALLMTGLGVSAVGNSLRQALRFRAAANFEQAVLREITSTMQESFEAGLSARETAASLEARLAGIAPTVAEMIAETQLTTLANERSLAVTQAVFRDETTSGGEKRPVYKTWTTVGDNRVRVAHAAAAGQTVPIAQPFNVGGFSMMYPGDPAAPLALVARCRCRMSYTETLLASAEEVVPVGILENPFLSDEMRARFENTSQTVTITVKEGERTTEGEGEEVEPAAWKALLAVEGAQTEDGRMIAEGALSWRELPLTLMALWETTEGGHLGAQLAGRIDEIWRDGNEVWGKGVFDTGEVGQEAARLVGERTLRGNSIDLAIREAEYRHAETGEVLEGEELIDAYFDDTPLLFVVTDGVIMASTVVTTPAIAEAEIMLASGRLKMKFYAAELLASAASAAEEEALTAGAAGLAPEVPPTGWFDDPLLEGPTPMTITPAGRIYGHAALWDTCHIAEPRGPGVCVPPPRSGMSYSIFHHGVITTQDDEVEVEVPCGQITLDTLHAPRHLSWADTQRHYEKTGLTVADVRAGEDVHGIWISGAVRPKVPAEKVREMKAGALSGDWRQVVGRGLEFIAALVVNVPGFPIPRPEATVTASAAGEEVVTALIAAGMVEPEEFEEPEMMSEREFMRRRHALTQ